MNFVIQSDSEFLQVALRSYDNPQCLTIDEFNRDLRGYITIKKTMMKYLTERDSSCVRRLVNMFIMYYNCFDSRANDLLIYKLNTPEYRSLLIPLALFLGRHTESLDLLDVSPDLLLIQELQRL